jgi:translation initiation factor 5
MPLLQTKIEGRGNGIKTVVPNMEDIARALNRPATCGCDASDPAAVP